MNLRWVFWTGLLAFLVFFSVVYFGIKYDWVGGSTPSTSTSNQLKELNSDTKLHTEGSQKDLTEPPSSANKGNGVSPELIDEAAVDVEGNALGSPNLTIEEVVTACQNVSESIGVPEDRTEQAVSECVDRNSRHLTAGNKTASQREVMIKEQCRVAITQKQLLSENEIKMLVDECFASMTRN